MANEVILSVDQDGWTGAFQLSVDLRRPDSSGHGYRISGPKFNGSSKSIFKHTLTERDAKELRRYLDLVWPAPPATAGKEGAE